MSDAMFLSSPLVMLNWRRPRKQLSGSRSHCSSSFVVGHATAHCDDSPLVAASPSPIMAGIGSHGGFAPVRNLLNPKFDSYLLSALDQTTLVSSHPLPAPIAAPQVPNSVYLPFHDVEYRIRHNHLTVSDGRVVYLSASYEVIAAHLDPATCQPIFSTIITLPKPANLDPPLFSEYPAIRAISGNVLAISDGAGQIHVVEAESPQNPGSGVLLDSYRLSTGEEDDMLPFRMHHVRLNKDEVHCVVSVSTRIQTPAPTSSKAAPSKTAYRLMSVSFKLPKVPHPGIQQLTVDWALNSSSLPLLLLHNPSAQRYIIASAAPFGAPAEPPPPDPQEDEIAPIPRPEENLNAVPVPAAREARPPPYSWTQAHDAVTVVFPLPSTTEKGSIRVLFSQQNLTLLVSDRGGGSAIPLPVYVRKPFWDGIHADTSYWTWEREAGSGSAVGLLTLHLDKQHEGTRWPHVFAASGTAEAGEEDVEVPETVDPSELAAIREQLEKWTASLPSEENAGLGRGVPSLLDGEMDEEVDEQVGSRVVFTYVSENGEAHCPAPLAPVDLLSIPLEHTAPSAVVKHTLDGLVFTPPTNGSPEEANYAWTHTATYPALAFVLASKRDVKFTFHHGPDLTLAFEGGTGKGLSIGGNVYMYKGAGGRSTAGQAVLRVSGGEEGPLMGVQLARLEGGKEALVCLCEKGLVVVRDVLGW
ncbi:hypothetical protein CALVIDRAFT_105308 [Calocera viscosa TUFC12733]|uniref:NudC domain-containing protein 1 n=1 Tax=Calocera viscosa (strain TUFC12733) TaxID=1330018 RepID=A0A167MPX7_CALVF|nr:hypothetical protein CALVIDRAFT_105308 [Calocera viscosa TUFC12733]